MTIPPGVPEWWIRYDHPHTRPPLANYGTDPPFPAVEVLAEPFDAFPSWFLRVECDRCGEASNAARPLRRKGKTGRRSSPEWQPVKAGRRCELYRGNR